MPELNHGPEQAAEIACNEAGADAIEAQGAEVQPVDPTAPVNSASPAQVQGAMDSLGIEPAQGSYGSLDDGTPPSPTSEPAVALTVDQVEDMATRNWMGGTGLSEG